MKKLFTIMFMLAVITVSAQMTVNLKDGKSFNGKTLSVTPETITLQWDSINKYVFNVGDVSTYFDGKNLINAKTGAIDKSYNSKYSTPGDELIKASKTYYMGMIISSIGILTSSVGSYAYGLTKNPDKDIQKAIVYAGSAIALVGVIINITAFSHISKAGRKLNAISGKDGLGISMNF
jgi:hypothetical protein